MFLKNELQSFLVALALLTRLGSAKILDNASLARSQKWFGVVGAMLGLIYLAVSYTLHKLDLGSAWVIAWVYVALDAYITRALHYDGLADVGDALGSGTSGEKFWDIMHDSRLGAFGALTLLLALSAQLIGAQQIIFEQKWYALLLAPIFGRVLCVLLANSVDPKNKNSLGAKVCSNKNKLLCFIYILISFVIMLPLGLKFAILAHILGAIFFYFLYITTKKHGGVNGDFFGFSIIGGQCIVLLVC